MGNTHDRSFNNDTRKGTLILAYFDKSTLFKANKKTSNKNTPVGLGLFKVNNRNTRTNFEICFKITIKTLDQGY